jgi:aminoglycoside 6'-N-acetyltransferase I
VKVRRAEPSDLTRIVEMKVQLWPEGTADEHRAETEATLRGEPPVTLLLVIFVADVGDEVAGFVEVDLRSHADGCDPRQPVGYVEGWFVEQKHRRAGVGAALIRAAEQWAREQGCKEMASDAVIANALSQVAHQSLGFEVVDRCVHYRKALAVTQ